jgi:hypothetical protein
MNKLLINLLPVEIKWLDLDTFDSTNPQAHAHEALVAKEKHGSDIEVVNAWVMPKNNYQEYDLIRADQHRNPIDKSQVLAIGVISRYFMYHPKQP